MIIHFSIILYNMLREWIEFIWPYLNFLLPRGVLLLTWIDPFVCPCACCCFESSFGVAGKSLISEPFLLGLYALQSIGPASFCASWWKSPEIPGHLERVGGLILTQQNHVRAKLRKMGRANPSNEKSFRKLWR